MHRCLLCLRSLLLHRFIAFIAVFFIPFVQYNWFLRAYQTRPLCWLRAFSMTSRLDGGCGMPPSRDPPFLCISAKYMCQELMSMPPCEVLLHRIFSLYFYRDRTFVFISSECWLDYYSISLTSWYCIACHASWLSAFSTSLHFSCSNYFVPTFYHAPDVWSCLNSYYSRQRSWIFWKPVVPFS